MKRIEEIDICKGLAILFVYLGHSILYYPYVESISNSVFFNIISRSIASFNMPLFFVISGFLFYGTRKSTMDIIKNKTIKLLVPYLVCMAIVIIFKQLLPSGMAYNQQNGLINIFKNVFLYGGDRWFVYVLFFIFIIVALFKRFLNQSVIFLFMILSVILSLFNFLPHIFLMDQVVKFIFFFLLGCIYKNNYQLLNILIIKYRYILYGSFILFNIVFVRDILPIPIFGDYIIQIIGITVCFILSFQIIKFKNNTGDNKVFEYIRYAGKYSLQFYLMSFAFPIIRTITINVLHFTNPFLIVSFVFILQLICITIIIEVTRRIKFLKVPLGY